MRKPILLLLIAIGCSQAKAEWQAVASGVNSNSYADTGSIRREGASAVMKVLIDYEKPPFDGNNLPYRSLTMRNEYNCDNARFRVLDITSHSKNMGGGERPYTTSEPGEWEPVSPTSIQKDLWELACAKTALPGE